MAHLCHAVDCTTAVLPRLFMCKAHWYRLRAPLRDAIWRHYRPGQEIDKNPTDAYLVVMLRSVGEVAFRPHDEAAARAALPWMLKAEMLRHMLVNRGQPDPLAGLAPWHASPNDLAAAVQKAAAP